MDHVERAKSLLEGAAGTRVENAARQMLGLAEIHALLAIVERLDRVVSELQNAAVSS